MRNEIFSILLSEQKINIDIDKDTIRDIKKEIQESNSQIPVLKNGYSSFASKDYRNDSRLASIMSQLENAVKSAWTECGLRKDLEPEIIKAYINVVPHGGKMSDQLHTEYTKLFGVLCLSGEESSGELSLLHPHDLFYDQLPFESSFTYRRHNLKVGTGDLVVFPAFLHFETTGNNSNEDRVTLEFYIHYKSR